MIVLLTAFSLFHLVVGVASVRLGLLLLSAEERAHWREKRALMVAELTCWVYPLAALAGAGFAWMNFFSGHHEAVPIVLAPLGWLIFMGIVFAIVDFAEDGVIGNARVNNPDA